MTSGPSFRPPAHCSGLATAPVLFAAEEHPELLPMIQRRFKQVHFGGGVELMAMPDGCGAVL